METMEVADGSGGAQIQIRFVTKQEIYAVPDVPFSVSQEIDNTHLNKLLNELLRENSEIVKSVEFDFLVLGQLLRVPLIAHLQEFNASTETTIDIEYVERTPAPEPEDALLHDDWIGGVQVADKCWALYPTNSNVVELTDENFDDLVINSDQVWIVEFFTPWCAHCQRFVSEYQNSADALKGVVKVGAVDVDKHGALGTRYVIQGFPTIKMFSTVKNKPSHYTGPRIARNLVNEALITVRNKVLANFGDFKDSSDVVELTDENFDELVMKSDDMWLVEFYAPWCGHCKNLQPQWVKAASELKGKAKLGALDATTNKIKASEYNIQVFPTIMYFSSGKKNSNSVSDYDGLRSTSNIVSWVLEKLMDNAAAPDILQILDDTSFNDVCNKSALCVVSFLPHILDCSAACRYRYLDILKDLSEQYKRYMWGWSWSEAGAQAALENAFDVGGFGYPTMAVVNMKKMKYSVLRGSFSSAGIKEFLRDISFGRGNIAAVPGTMLPAIVKTDPWDGKHDILPTEDFDVPENDTDASEAALNAKEEL